MISVAIDADDYAGVLDSSVWKYEFGADRTDRGQRSPADQAFEPARRQRLRIVVEKDQRIRSRFSRPVVTQSGKIERARSLEQAKAGVARNFGEIGARSRFAAPVVDNDHLEIGFIGEAHQALDASSQQVDSIARGDDDRSAEMSTRSGRRRGGAARPRRWRAGEQNAADMRYSAAHADGHRRRPGNEIGDGEYARSRARPADAREPRAADEVDALSQDGAPVGFQPRHRAVADALLIAVKEIGIIAHRSNPRDRKSFGRPFVLGPRHDDEVARLEIGEAVAKRRARRQRDDARLRDRRRFEMGRQRPARPGLRPQPAEPARDRPTVCLRQNDADMRTLFRLRRQRVEAAPIRRPATRLAPRLVAFERCRHERAAEMALGEMWLADQAKTEGEQRMARAPSARQTLGKRNLTQADDAETEWTRPIGRRDPDGAGFGGDLAEPDRPTEQRPRQDFLLHAVRRQAAQQRARQRIDETGFVSQLDPAIGGDPARELQP